jgi:hypothetical protein
LREAGFLNISDVDIVSLQHDSAFSEGLPVDIFWPFCAN